MNNQKPRIESQWTASFLDLASPTAVAIGSGLIAVNDEVGLALDVVVSGASLTVDLMAACNDDAAIVVEISAFETGTWRPRVLAAILTPWKVFCVGSVTASVFG